MKLIDARGLSCPEPVLRARKGFQTLESGQSLVVAVDTMSASESVQREARQSGLSISMEEKDGDYHITVVKP